MSMEYCRECDRMIDLDYDLEHECFLKGECVVCGKKMESQTQSHLKHVLKQHMATHKLLTKQTELGQYAGKEFNHDIAGEKFA